MQDKINDIYRRLDNMGCDISDVKSDLNTVAREVDIDLWW